MYWLRLIFEDENSAVFRFANTGINRSVREPPMS